MVPPRIVLFTGKGGAGKTTCAAAFALAWARRGRPAMLASLDPAHNLGDVLGLELGPEAREVLPGLRAMEADLDAEERGHVNRAKELVRRRYRYLTVASMEPIIELLGDAPGQPEQAAVEVMMKLADGTDQTDETLVVDLPPSGQAWRILAFPTLMERWCKSLEKLRGRILDRRKTLNHLLGDDSPARAPNHGKTTPEKLTSVRDADPVTGTLRSFIRRHGALARTLKDPEKAWIVGVALPDTLAIRETRRLKDRLGANGMRLTALLLNRAGPGSKMPNDLRPDVIFPDLGHGPRGPAELADWDELMGVLIDGPSTLKQ
ncbi:MAG: ArsA family ATPase [Deltaproteobacteria bacterium]|nr:ArsA family ATPase [Deltaproteobacteria bacterium]